jgi:uncharacterized protein
MGDERSRHIDRIWSADRIPVLIGMVHLAPLPGAPRSSGTLAEIMERAVTDAARLERAGFDGVLVENYGDVPFHPGEVPPVTIAAMTRIVSAVLDAVSLPVGVNVLRNDARAALSIAAITGAAFVRVNVHSGSMWTDQGLLTGTAHETLRLRAALGTGTAILADVHVKHAVPPGGTTIEQAAADAWHRGLADGLIVSGSGTGLATDPGDIEAVTRSVPDAPIFLGSGVTEATAGALPPRARGAIVGSAVMRDGVAGSGVDERRAEAFVRAARRSS